MTNRHIEESHYSCSGFRARFLYFLIFCAFVRRVRNEGAQFGSAEYAEAGHSSLQLASCPRNCNRETRTTFDSSGFVAGRLT